MGSFAETTYWRVLEPDQEPTKEPSNPLFKNPRAPTIEERDAKYVPVKFGFFKHNFNIPSFSAILKGFCDGHMEGRRRTAKGKCRRNIIIEKLAVLTQRSSS